MFNYLVEFFGSLFFIFIVLTTGNPLAMGAAYTLVILVTQNISGGYIVPSVAIVMAAAGQLDASELLPYCLVQIFGGLVAFEIYKRVKE
jgi:glycerol uptake facilitator-like aquaporin